MILTEKEKLFIQAFLGTEDGKAVFTEICNKKINDLKDLTTFKTREFEKDLTFNEIYSGRMAAMLAIKNLAEELLANAVANAGNEPAQREPKHM